MTAALFLFQDIDLAGKLGVRMNGTGLGQNLAALDLIALDAAEQSTHVVASLSEVQQLAEHLKAGNGGLTLLFDETDDLDFLANLDDATLHTTGSNSAAAGDGEHVLNRHQERHILFAVGSGDIAVHSLHQIEDALVLGGVDVRGAGLQNLQSRTTDDGRVVAGELILGQQLTDLHLDEIQQLFVVHLVALVHEHDDIGNADLTGEQDVLTGLGHGAVGSRHDQNRAVHLSSAGDHVLHIVGVARAVNMGIVTVVRLVLHVRGVDRDAALALLGSLIDVGIIGELGVALHGQHLRDGSGQGRLAMVNVTNGADVDMRFVTLKFRFRHCYCPPLF